MYDLSESTSTLIKKASKLYIRLANLYLKQINVPHAYTPFLMQLWEKDGQTQAALHKKIGIEQPTAVRTLDRMERDKFIKRKRSNEDRRVIYICLTEYGKSLQKEIIDYARKVNDRALQGISIADKNKLNKLLNKLILNIEASLLDD